MLSPACRLLLALALAASQLLLLCSCRRDAEARTECFARCLAEFRLQASAPLSEKLHSQPQWINKECGRRAGTDVQARANCNACRHTCNHYKTKKFERHEDCSSFCRTAFGSSSSLWPTCRQACQTVQQLLATNQGDCPAAPASPSSLAADCRPAGLPCSAGSDAGCHGRVPMKCCDTGCGYGCVRANITLGLLPPVPEAPRLRRWWRSGQQQRLRRRNEIAMSWRSYDLAAFPQPVVFLMQFKSCKSYKYDPVRMRTATWKDLAFSTRTRMSVDLMVGHWYRFRLAAVSTLGFRNYSEASEPIKLPLEPDIPGPVRGLREGTSRMYKNAVHVQLHWLPPSHSDLEVSKYEIKWFRLLAAGHPSVRGFDAQVPAARRDFLLQKLIPATNYSVSVRAVANYGADVQLESPWATIDVAVMPRPTQAPRAPSDAELPQWQRRTPQAQQPPADCSCTQQPKTPLKTMQPYYANGDLKMMLVWFNSQQTAEEYLFASSYTVEWSKKVCIESRPSGRSSRKAAVGEVLTFLITGLQFNCYYSLRFRGLTRSGDVQFEWNTCFCTASCKETEIQGNRLPDCPQNEGTILPQPPSGVEWEILKPRAVPGGNEQLPIAARVRWATPVPLDTVQGFRITWGPREREEVDPGAYSSRLWPRMDAQRSETKVVSVRVREFVLRNLSPGTVYVVSIRTMTLVGDSRPAEDFFVTPSDRSSSEVQKYINVGGGAAATAPAAAGLLLPALAAHWLLPRC